MTVISSIFMPTAASGNFLVFSSLSETNKKNFFQFETVSGLAALFAEILSGFKAFYY
jgi:hypothetical protein